LNLAAIVALKEQLKKGKWRRKKKRKGTKKEKRKKEKKKGRGIIKELKEDNKKLENK
jgi:hypothetical protein